MRSARSPGAISSRFSETGAGRNPRSVPIWWNSNPAESERSKKPRVGAIEQAKTIFARFNVKIRKEFPVHQRSAAAHFPASRAIQMLGETK